MTITIAVANQKGGCAKTTTAVNLAAALAELKQRVLLIDLDPQANASHWLGAASDAPGVFEVLTTKVSVNGLLVATPTEGLSLLAGSRSLASIEKSLAAELSVETLLKRRLASLESLSFDYVLIDTPPTLGLMTVNALCAANQVLIPVTTHVMTLSGVAQLMQTFEDVKGVLNPGLSLLGLLPCRVDQRTRHSKDIVEALIARFGQQVLVARIRENIRLAEAPSFQKTILQYQPNSNVAEDFRTLAHEVVSHRSR
ncbi:MAG: ParA family protein [Alcaligenaceae bacterium]